MSCRLPSILRQAGYFPTCIGTNVSEATGLLAGVAHSTPDASDHIAAVKADVGEATSPRGASEAAEQSHGIMYALRVAYVIRLPLFTMFLIYVVTLAVFPGEKRV